MNWQNAKSLTLMFLVVLNIFLSVLVYAGRENYRLSASAERAIVTLLSENQISLEATLPKEYKPLSQLLMTPGVFDTDIFLKIFFPNPQEAKITLEYDKTIYKTDYETLVFQNGNATYAKNDTSIKMELGRAAAIDLCNAFLKKNQAYLSSYTLDRCVASENGFSIEYRQTYKSKLVFSNSIVFEVTENGISMVRCKYDNVISFENYEKEIISPDRALFILMKYIKNEFESKAVSIKEMDVVYIQVETSVNADAALKASPYYRFYYSENDMPVLINAYTGVIFDYAY